MEKKKTMIKPMKYSKQIKHYLSVRTRLGRLFILVAAQMILKLRSINANVTQW